MKVKGRIRDGKGRGENGHRPPTILKAALRSVNTARILGRKSFTDVKKQCQ